MRQTICPPSLKAAAQATGFSPAVRAGDFLYFTGAVGVNDGGDMPLDAGAQTATALTKVVAILAEVGAGPEALVEITSYHTDLDADFDTTQSAMTAALGTPLPAWTAVEVQGLRRPGARVEFRCVAFHPAGAPNRVQA